MNKNLPWEARMASFRDINRGQPRKVLPDHPFDYPHTTVQPETPNIHPAGFSKYLGNQGPLELFENLPAKFDSSNKFIAPPVPQAETKVYRLPPLGSSEKSQRPSPQASCHKLRIFETSDGVKFGGKRTFPGRD